MVVPVQVFVNEESQEVGVSLSLNLNIINQVLEFCPELASSDDR